MRAIHPLSIIAGILLAPTINSVAQPESAGAYSPPAAPAAVGSGDAKSFAVARVYFPDRAALNRLASELDIWEVRFELGFLVAALRPAQQEYLSSLGYRVEVLPELTALHTTPRAALAEQTAGIPAYPCYRTVEEIHATLAGLAVSHPTLASWIQIGESWDKTQSGGAAGHDLFALILSNQERPGPKFKFFLMAESHAREYATSELATRFAELLVTQYGLDPDVTWLLDYGELHLVAMLNPDGRKLAEQGVLWRKNTDNDDGCTAYPNYGTDLSRNHSFRWGQAGSSGTPCDVLYRGPAPLSEPEVQVLNRYVSSLFPDQRGPADADAAPADASGLFLSLHSYGDLVMFPWGWTSTASPNATALQSLGRKFGYHNGYQVQRLYDLYVTSGTEADWAYGELGLASYVVELGNAFFQDCDTFTNTIVPANLPVLLYAFKAARRPYQAPSAPDTLQVQVSPSVSAPGGQVRVGGVADDTRYNSGGHGTEPVHAITATRYSINAPSWEAGTALSPLAITPLAPNSALATFEGYVSTEGLSPGRHTLFVESQDATGHWGVPTAAFLEVGGPLQPNIHDQPQSVSTPPGSNVVFTVVATGASPLSYQWQRSGTNLPGATATTLLLPNVQVADDGLYTVVVTDANSSVMSSPARLSVLVTPVILQPPLSQTVVAGGTVTLSVAISGNPPPFLFQWRRDSVILTNIVQSGKAGFFTLANVQATDGGLHQLAVTNAASPLLTGVYANFTITVLPDTDADGLPDTWETEAGISQTSANHATADDDGDGVTNGAEYVAGTDPTNPLNFLKVEGIGLDAGDKTVRLEFLAVSNKTYTVEYLEELGAAGWQRLADVVAVSTNGMVELRDPAGGTHSQRLYRLVTPRVPQ